MDKSYFVYILTNTSNKVLYKGITSNIQKRVWEHKNHVVSGFTDKYNVNKLVYYEVFEEAESAIKREKSIKNLLRRKKIDLIEKDNPKYIDLYESL